MSFIDNDYYCKYARVDYCKNCVHLKNVAKRQMKCVITKLKTSLIAFHNRLIGYFYK